VGLVSVRLQRGDLAGAERAARRWVALQPTLPGAWQMLAEAVEYSGRVDEAIDDERRALLLSADPLYAITLGRTLLAGRRYRAVDSLVATLRARPEPLARDGALDLGVMLARERGTFGRASRLLAPVARTSGLALLQADDLARLGRLADARALYEWAGHEGARTPDADPSAARAYTWAHALEGDALWQAGDTASLRALADSVARVGVHSYYGRDWVVPHHLAGLLALARGDSATAERQLAAARWGAFGWTRTVVALGRLQLARGRAADAIATLREAYRGPLDAMGRYVPRSEVDYWLAQAYARAGLADSARAYAGYVRAAWADADPDVRRRLATLPR